MCGIMLSYRTDNSLKYLKIHLNKHFYNNAGCCFHGEKGRKIDRTFEFLIRCLLIIDKLVTEKQLKGLERLYSQFRKFGKWVLTLRNSNLKKSVKADLLRRN